MGVGTLGGLIAAFISGHTADLIGRKWTWVIGNLMTGVFYLLRMLSPDWWVFALLGIGTGIFTSMSMVSFGALIPEEVPPEKRNTIFSYATALGVVGALNSSLLVLLAGVFPILTWQHLLLYVVIWNFFVAILGAVVLKESRLWLERRKLIKEGKIERESRLPISRFLTKELRTRFLLVIIVSTCSALSFGTLGFRAFYESSIMRWSLVTIGAVGIIMTIGGTISKIVFGRMSDRIGRLNTFLVINVMAIIGALLFWHTPFILGTGEYLPIIAFYTFFFIVWVWGLNGESDLEMVWTSELFPTAIRGSALSIRGIFSYILRFFAASISGWLALFVGLGTAYSMFTIIGSAIIIIAILAAKNSDWKQKLLC
jgi:MFS family permease